MIRRDHEDDWLLIAQIDHARLAAEIAAVWGNDVVPPLPVSDLLVPAIRHHDDGWQKWAAAPQIDPDTGRPLNFTEMPMAVSTAIWEQSIDICSRQAPLSGIWVSRHFCWLAEQTHQSRKDHAEDLAAIEKFLDAQGERQRRLKEKEAEQTHALVSVSPDSLDSLMEAGFRFLQFFDALSIWLCCEPQSEPHETTLHENGPICWAPLGVTGKGVTGIHAEPFPLSVNRLDLTVSVRIIPVREYADDADLHSALQTATRGCLNWAIVP